MDMLNVSHVSKSFGSRKIIDDVSLTVKKGSIYGFIGENGAGKTTTMKMVLGLMKPDSGEIYVNGQKVTYGQTATNSFIGYLPDVPEFYNYMTPKEYLTLCARITGMDKNTYTKRIPELLELVDLTKSDKRIRGFSRGMKQRLGIAQALINAPKLLICDEPTSALDPAGRKEMLDIIMRIKEHTTVLFSTHILSDVERVCDTIGFLHQGKIIKEAPIEQIIYNNSDSKYGDGFIIEFFNEQDKITFSSMFRQDGYECEDSEHNRITCRQGKKAYIAAMNVMTHNEILPAKMERMEQTLESVFMEVVNR